MIKMKMVHKLVVTTLMLCALSLPAAVSYGEEVMYSAARTREGIIRSIDYATRTAIISGYTYSFGDPGTNYFPPVTMVGSDFGSFELLQVGMKVRVVYGEFGFIRVVVRLEQLPDDTLLKLI